MGYSGYYMVFRPERSDANNLGFVAEHRVVAEEILGRPLKDGEVVHHIDRNRRNNDPSNIIVFESRAAHSRFHQGGKLIETDEPNVYTSDYVYPEIPCGYCGTMFRPKAATSKYCCQECSALAQRKVDRPDKRQLKKLILNYSITDIAEMYGVTGNGVRRWLQYESLPFKHKDIKKLRERERIKQEKNAVKKEMKERIIERDKAIEANSDDDDE